MSALLLRFGLPALLVLGAWGLGRHQGWERATDRCGAARTAALEALYDADRALTAAAGEAARRALLAEQRAREAASRARAEARAELETEMARLRREIANAEADPLCPDPRLAGGRLRIARDAAASANRLAGAGDHPRDGAGGDRPAGP